jgi:hypothetical protein
MTAIACPFCQVQLPANDLAEGWCDNCGKKLPAFVRSEAARAGIRPAGPTIPPVSWKALSTSEAPTAGTAPTGSGNRRKTMITLRGRNEWMTESLPSLCMCCGSPATSTKEKKFGWFPRWISLLAPIGGLPFLIALMLSRKMMTVKIPLCQRHRRPWLRQQLFAVLVLAYVLVLPWLLITLSVAAEKTWSRGNPGSLALLFGWFLGFPILFVLLFVVKRLAPHVKKITTDSITLGGVSEDFAQQLHGRAWR